MKTTRVLVVAFLIANDLALAKDNKRAFRGIKAAGIGTGTKGEDNR